MNRLRLALGYLGGLFLVVSSAAHVLAGWKNFSAALASMRAPADVVTGLAIGWYFAGVAMFVFGCIVIWELANVGRRGSLALWPVLLIGAMYIAFGIWARLISALDFFLMAFVLPGVLLVVAAWPTGTSASASGA